MRTAGFRVQCIAVFIIVFNSLSCNSGMIRFLIASLKPFWLNSVDQFKLSLSLNWLKILNFIFFKHLSIKHFSLNWLQWLFLSKKFYTLSNVLNIFTRHINIVKVLLGYIASSTVYTGVMWSSPVLCVVQGNLGVTPIDKYGCQSQTPPIPALWESFIPGLRRHAPDREVSEWISIVK